MTDRRMPVQSIEYLKGTVTADIELGTQPVDISFDRTTWYPATWTGDPANTRGWELLIDDTTRPTRRSVSVFVRITDNPEIPVMRAGTLNLY